MLLAMRRVRATWVRLPWYVRIAVRMASRSTASRPVTGREPGAPEVGGPPALAAATSAGRSATVTRSPVVRSRPRDAAAPAGPASPPGLFERAQEVLPFRVTEGHGMVGRAGDGRRRWHGGRQFRERRLELRCMRENHGALDDVFELAHIAGPVVCPYGQKTHSVKARGIVGTVLMLCPCYASKNGG